MELLICIGLFFLDLILLCKSFDVILETLLFIEEWRKTQELEGNDENDRGIEHRRGGNQQADDEGPEASSESMEDEERGRGLHRSHNARLTIRAFCRLLLLIVQRTSAS